MTKWILCVLFLFGAMFAWRARPVMHPEESYQSIFPTARFLAKLNSPIAAWMQTEIDSNFRDIEQVTESALSRTYDTICKRVGRKSAFYRYRILDNELYAYVPTGAKCSTKDIRFEKALKTLLTHAQIPNVDFIYCQMDGVPEDHVPADFFFMDDPKDQAPILAQAKRKGLLTRYVVLIPDQFSLDRDWIETAVEIERINQTIAWGEKEAKAFWRGIFTDTGDPAQFLTSSQKTPRMSISYLSAMHPQSVDAGMTRTILPELEQRWGLQGILKKEASKADHLRAKYLPVLDGHMCTYPGYQWRLLSNSLCLKQESDQVQWFYSALQPYRHYVPIANDMSDLLAKITWANDHEEEVLTIIQTAQQFARDNLMVEDNYRYLALVLQRYAKVQQIDFETTHSDPHWVCIHYRKRLAFFNMLRKKLPIFDRN